MISLTGWKLYAAGGAGLFLAGFGAGCWLTNALHKAAETGGLVKETVRLEGEVAEQFSLGKAAVALTREITAIPERHAQIWAAGLSQVDIEIQPIRIRTQTVLKEIDRVEDPTGCLDQPVPYELCVAEARSGGRDPDLQCASLDSVQ